MDGKTKAIKATFMTPQIHVRTGVRSGDALAKCQKEVAQLDKHYQNLLADARQRGISV